MKAHEDSARIDEAEVDEPESGEGGTDEASEDDEEGKEAAGKGEEVEGEVGGAGEPEEAGERPKGCATGSVRLLSDPFDEPRGRSEACFPDEESDLRPPRGDRDEVNDPHSPDEKRTSDAMAVGIKSENELPVRFGHGSI